MKIRMKVSLKQIPSFMMAMIRHAQSTQNNILCNIFAASLEPLAHRWNVASLSLFYRYYFGRCFSELVQLVPLPFSWGGSTLYSGSFHGFSVTISRCYKDVYANSFFPCAASFWNPLPIECFPLTNNLNDFQSTINKTEK